MVVQLGDVIRVPNLSNVGKEIEWQQNFSNKKEIFYPWPFENVTKGGSDIIFVQKSYLDQWRKKAKRITYSSGILSLIQATDNEWFEVKVDNDFQYGQNAEQNQRFLVFHDKSNKAYQHRFMSSNVLQGLVDNYGGALAKVTGMGSMVSDATSLAKSYVGDPLRNF